MTERKHRCGGVLRSEMVQLHDERGGIVVVYSVPGLVCGSCGTELIERDRAVEIFKQAQTPMVMWSAPGANASTNAAWNFVQEPIRLYNRSLMPA